MPAAATSFIDRHRGPFRLCLTRPHPRKKDRVTTEWLRGVTSSEDVESEARALLQDPRDTITSVSVWSVREEQFVGGYRR